MAIRYAVMIGLPCSLGMSAMAEPILRMIYKESSAVIAAPLLTCLAPSSFFVCVLAVTNSVLQACGHERAPVVSMLCGAVVKCAAGVVFLRQYGIMGAPLSTLVCYLTVTAINFAFVVKYTGIRPPFSKTFGLPLVASVLSSTAAVVVYRLLSSVPQRVACIAGICSAAAVYAGFLLLTGTVKTDEFTEIIKKGRKYET